MKKTALIASVVLTAFLLILLGGILTKLRTPDQASAAVVPTSTEISPIASPTTDQSVIQTFQAREATYQDLIAQANARLEQAQKEQQALQEQLNALQASPQAAPPQTVVTPQMAAQVAEQYKRSNSVYSVETVQQNGVTLYKVTFSSGDLVFVSLDGQVVSQQNASVASNPAASQPVLTGGEHENHEGGNDD